LTQYQGSKGHSATFDASGRIPTQCGRISLGFLILATPIFYISAFRLR
jgi:hypothetical protein